MRRKPTLLDDHDDHALRFAWGVAFIATLTVVAILGLARSAQALTVPGPALVAAAAPAPFDDEEEDEAEASEDEEFEAGECEEEEEECDAAAAEGGPEAPVECLLSSAQATVFAAASHDRIRLEVRYTANSPTPVAFDYGLHGSKGSLFLGGEKKQLARHGVLRLTKSLTEAQMEKVMAAKSFTVRLRVPAAPRYCQDLFDRQLGVRRAIPTGLSWQQSE